MQKTKIDWCDYSWNPVWGCLNNCKYCYARKIAKRFVEQMEDYEYEYCFNNYFLFPSTFSSAEFWNEIKNFKPVFINRNYSKKFPKKPSKIFVNSMSDIYFWKREWIKKVLEKIKKYPQHIFMFLTKFPEIYDYLKFPDNCWLGATIDCSENPIIEKNDGGQRIWTAIDLDSLTHLKSSGYNNKVFISFEPLLNNPKPYLEMYCFPFVDWVIIGAQTNPYKPPKKEWVEDIIDGAKKRNIPVFMKNSIKNIKPFLQEFPIKKKQKKLDWMKEEKKC